jgi:hypothetical protein
MRDLLVASITGVVVLIGGAAIAAAQPEDRQREPTASASVDPCARFGFVREQGGTTWPGFDPRIPVPRGATSFTGVGRPTREIASGLPPPVAPTGPLSPTDPVYQECLRRRDR